MSVMTCGSCECWTLLTLDQSCSTMPSFIWKHNVSNLPDQSLVLVLDDVCLFFCPERAHKHRHSARVYDSKGLLQVLLWMKRDFLAVNLCGIGWLITWQIKFKAQVKQTWRSGDTEKEKFLFFYIPELESLALFKWKQMFVWHSACSSHRREGISESFS